MNNILIFLLTTFHKLLVYFMFFGCILPPKYLPLHIALWPIVYVHWQFNNNKCILTELELKMRGIKKIPSVENDHGSDYYFMKKILSDMNISLTDHQMKYMTYILFTVSWLVSIKRYANSSCQ